MLCLQKAFKKVIIIIIIVNTILGEGIQDQDWLKEQKLWQASGHARDWEEKYETLNPWEGSNRQPDMRTHSGGEPASESKCPLSYPLNS